jgi:aryl-alcohol dehydrogenase-like predicted oxidoreductase
MAPGSSLWNKVPFGRTGLSVSRLAIGSSYGIGGADLERAFERGLDFMFYGLRRPAHFARGVRAVARGHRDELVVAIQSYSRSALLLRPSVELALRELRLDHVDLLGLGWWNDVPPARILDAARALQAAGKVRHLLVSSHHRPTFERLMADPTFGGIMVRYNAAHPGAEKEVFPHLAPPRPGVLAFTATRWRTLLDPALIPPGERVPTATDCYRFVLSCPDVDVSLTGPRDGAELDAAMKALDLGPMDAEELAWMKRVGVVVRRDAKGGAPVELLDKLAAKLRGERPGGASAAR